SDVFDQLDVLLSVARGIQWDRRAARRDRPKIRRHPPWMVVRQDGTARTRLESVSRDPARDRLRHAPQFSVGVALHALGPLDLQRDGVGPALDALQETVVEGPHDQSPHITYFAHIVLPPPD